MAVDEALCRTVGYVDSAGERIYYETTGAGRPVVLCHGLGGNHAIWWQQVEAFAGRHRLVVWDQRGFGNSTLTSGEVGPVAARSDLTALVDHLGLDDFDLVGQSMGGWVALGMALQMPARVHSLVLSTTLAGAPKRFVDRLISAEPDRDRLNRREHPVLSAEFCKASPDLAVLYNQIASFGARPDPATVLTAMAEDRFDAAALQRLAVDTLVLVATEDDLCPPAAMADFVSSLPNGRLVELVGDHSVYYERPTAWNDAVLEFLERP